MASLPPGVRVNGVSCLDNRPEVRWVTFTVQPGRDEQTDGRTDGRTDEPNELADKQIGERERGAAEVESNLVPLKLLFDWNNDLQFIVAGGSVGVHCWGDDTERK